MIAFWKYNVYRVLRYTVDGSASETAEALKANFKWSYVVKEDRIAIRSGILDLSRKPIDVFVSPGAFGKTEVRFHIHDLMPLVNYAIIPATAIAMAIGFYTKGLWQGERAIVLFTFGLLAFILAGLWLFIFVEERVSTLARKYVEKLMKTIVLKSA